MAEESAATVRAMIDAFRRGDMDAALDHMDPDIVWEPDMPDHPVFQGREGVLRFFRSWLGTWEDYEFTQHELVDLGDGRVFSRFRERGTGRGSGVAVDREFAGIYEVRAGRVARWTRHSSVEDAERAAGLRD